jgi:phosphoglucomutase
MTISPLAGKPAAPAMLVNVPRLVSAYYTEVPDPAIPAQQVAFGTSGHRGSAFQKTFNEWHVLAITQAICRHRAQQAVDGPLFLGIDTHALSVPACASALEVSCIRVPSGRPRSRTWPPDWPGHAPSG